MPRRRPIYENRAALRFREIVRPAMIGRIASVEPNMSYRMADELFDWLNSVIRQAMQATRLHDDKNSIRQQLLQGMRVIGRASMRTLTGRIDVYPWIFPHEFGAVGPNAIKPIQAEALTVPIAYGLRPDGRPKFRTASAWKRYGSFVYKPKGSDTAFIAYKSASGDLRLLYVLKEKIEIPARLGLNKMAAAELGRLLVAWQAIFIQEAARVGLYNPWEEPRG